VQAHPSPPGRCSVPVRACRGAPVRWGTAPLRQALLGRCAGMQYPESALYTLLGILRKSLWVTSYYTMR
jgi:hypothetical protein